MYSNDQQPKPRKPVTVSRLRQMKVDGEKIVMLTAYDASFAALMDAQGVDVILVGDSLANVMQGQSATTPVTVDEMVYHTTCVTRKQGSTFVVTDLPFMSYCTVEKALESAARLMKEGGAQMVKLEGGNEQVDVVRALTGQGVPVCGHLGLLPQSVHKVGGYKVHGREKSEADRLLEEAGALEDAGIDLLVLECIPAELGARITQKVSVPVIGIGAGPDCDGQVLVMQDMLGITPGKRPSFSHDFMQDADSIAGAVSAYVQAVKNGTFPTSEHSFK